MPPIQVAVMPIIGGGDTAATRMMTRDEVDYLLGRMSEEELKARQQARWRGAGIGGAIGGTIVFGGWLAIETGAVGAVASGLEAMEMGFTVSIPQMMTLESMGASGGLTMLGRMAGAARALAAAAGVGRVVDKAFDASKALPPNSLTAAEAAEIQAIANKYDTTIDIVGSRAAGLGRNIDNPDLPIDLPGGRKGPRSDIDFRFDTAHPKAGDLMDELNQVGNGAGSARMDKSNNLLVEGGRDSYDPFIQFRPRKQ